MTFHLRYTPYELGTDFTFLDKYDKYLIAYEQLNKSGKPTKPHFHIYIESGLDMDTIRGDVLKGLGIPKAGRGKNNQYYCLKIWDNNLSYFVKQNNIRGKKGITDLEVAAACAAAEAFRSPLKGGKDTSPAAAPAAKKEKETEWNKLLMNAMLYHKNNGSKEVPYEKWVKLIRFWCLKDLKPFPHPANTKRYAQSLDCLARSDWGEDETLLEKETSQIAMPD